MGSEVPPHRIQKRASAGISDLNTKVCFYTALAAKQDILNIKIFVTLC